MSLRMNRWTLLDELTDLIENANLPPLVSDHLIAGATDLIQDQDFSEVIADQEKLADRADILDDWTLLHEIESGSDFLLLDVYGGSELANINKRSSTYTYVVSGFNCFTYGSAHLSPVTAFNLLVQDQLLLEGIVTEDELDDLLPKMNIVVAPRLLAELAVEHAKYYARYDRYYRKGRTCMLQGVDWLSSPIAVISDDILASSAYVYICDEDY